MRNILELAAFARAHDASALAEGCVTFARSEINMRPLLTAHTREVLVEAVGEDAVSFMEKAVARSAQVAEDACSAVEAPPPAPATPDLRA